MKTIYIIRHGEKPGLNHVEHMDDGIHLSARGHSRAAALAHQVDELFGISKHTDIDYIFATAESHASRRPIQTVEPLSIFCKKKIKAKYSDEDYKKLANKLLSNKKYDDKIIVICWHHGKIPSLVKALGGKHINPFPKGKWGDDVFDMVVKLEYNNTEVSISSFPQKLLHGDTE